MTRRPKLSKKARAAIFVAHGGICHICQGKITVGEAWEVEHVIPLAISGDNSNANLRPAHAKCHKTKTAADARDIGKAKRREAKHTGAARPKGTIPGSKASRFKRRIDGTIIDRQTGEEIGND